MLSLVLDVDSLSEDETFLIGVKDLYEDRLATCVRNAEEVAPYNV